MVTVGSSTSASTEYRKDAMLPLLSLSVATFSATSTVTVPLPVGVMMSQRASPPDSAHRGHPSVAHRHVRLLEPRHRLREVDVHE